MAEEKTGACFSCDHEGRVREYPHMDYQQKGRTVSLCELCAKTLAGNAACYPTAYPDAAVMRLIAQCTNMILDAIKKQGSVE